MVSSSGMNAHIFGTIPNGVRPRSGILGRGKRTPSSGEDDVYITAGFDAKPLWRVWVKMMKPSHSQWVEYPKNSRASDSLSPKGVHTLFYALNSICWIEIQCFSVSSPFVSIDLWWFMGETRTSHGSHGSQGKHWRQRCHRHLPSRLLRPRLLWPRLQLLDWSSSVQAGPTAWLLNQGFLYHDYHQTRGFIWFNHEQWGYNGDIMGI